MTSCIFQLSGPLQTNPMRCAIPALITSSVPRLLVKLTVVLPLVFVQTPPLTEKPPSITVPLCMMVAVLGSLIVPVCSRMWFVCAVEDASALDKVALGSVGPPLFASDPVGETCMMPQVLGDILTTQVLVAFAEPQASPTVTVTV